MSLLPDIKCTVSECFFWKDDLCRASAIEVAPRQGTRSAYLDAGTVGAGHPAVEHSVDTQCVTFRPRGTDRAQPDERDATGRGQTPSAPGRAGSTRTT